LGVRAKPETYVAPRPLFFIPSLDNHKVIVFGTLAGRIGAFFTTRPRGPPS
jgi:hypothetical protein